MSTEFHAYFLATQPPPGKAPPSRNDLTQGIGWWEQKGEQEGWGWYWRDLAERDARIGEKGALSLVLEVATELVSAMETALCKDLSGDERVLLWIHGEPHSLVWDEDAEGFHEEE